jgi:hypothetical protein
MRYRKALSFGLLFFISPSSIVSAQAPPSSPPPPPPPAMIGTNAKDTLKINSLIQENYDLKRRIMLLEEYAGALKKEKEQCIQKGSGETNGKNK